MPDRPAHLRAVPTDQPAKRVTGKHWWDPDRQAHLADKPNHCPDCGQKLVIETGLAVEYWEGDDRVYHVWCSNCRWAGDVIRRHRMIGHEAEHE